MSRRPRARLSAEQRIMLEVQRRRRRADENARRRASYYTDDLEDVGIDEIRVRDDATCHLCGLWVDPGEQTLDHVTPLARRGAHTRENVKLAHRVCNSRKGSRLMSEIDFSEW